MSMRCGWATRTQSAFLYGAAGAHSTSRKATAQLERVPSRSGRRCQLSSRSKAREWNTTDTSPIGWSRTIHSLENKGEARSDTQVRDGASSTNELKPEWRLLKPRTNEVILQEVKDLARKLDKMSREHGTDDGGWSSADEAAHGLPLPPLLDPRLIKARNRHKTSKAYPSEPRTEFEKALASNPFGETAHRLMLQAFVCIHL